METVGSHRALEAAFSGVDTRGEAIVTAAVVISSVAALEGCVREAKMEANAAVEVVV